MLKATGYSAKRRRDRESRRTLIVRVIWVLACIIGICITLLRDQDLKASANVQTNNSSQDKVWQYVEEGSIATAGRRSIIPQKYRTVRLNQDELRKALDRAPMEFTDQARQTPLVISLPMPDSSFVHFRVEESPMMEPPLAAQFPEIRTYRGQGIDDPAATTRFDWTQTGFHAMVLSSAGTVYIDPYSDGDTVNYITYAKRDHIRLDKEFVCTLDLENPALPESSNNQIPHFVSGSTLRTYRLALAATGEYTAAAGGTVPLALARMTTSMNRVNGIYEREVAVRMTLVANESLIIYTDGLTDPYTNSSGSTMLGQNQTNIDNVIGSANYDIGHVFSTGGGGVASVGVPCRVSLKARGVTGLPNPVGDGFDVDFVAHEMGHQYGAAHTFNGTLSNCGGGNRSGSAAYEPGSGSTIMAYAGICGSQNLQPHSDDYFHSKSVDQIIAYITGANGNSCPVQTATGNTPPTVDAGSNFTIPRGTPFMLTATASDPNNPALTYCWEEFDLGPSSPPDTDADGQTRPVLRSYLPSSNPARTFPSLQYILNNSNVPPSTYSCPPGTCLTGEILPSINRTMTFQVTARDNNAGGGGISSDTVQVTVNASAGPFNVTQPNTAVTLAGGTLQTVTWNVAGTSGAPVSTANVKISLSTDGGSTFPAVLAASTPNDGSEAVTLPGAGSTQARVKVEAVGNIFFDISDANFTITAAVTSTDTIGLFRSTGNLFFLRNSNTPGLPDIIVAFGAPGDLPIVGDWDGDGTTTIGLYRPSTSTFFLRNTNTAGFPDVIVSFGDGPGGDLPIVGDWDGDGDTTIGVYRPSTSTFYLRNSNTLGFPDLSIPFGASGDMPLVGDWDGDGDTTIGVFRPANNSFFLRNSNATGFPDINVLFGAAGDLPLAGDWDGNGTTTIGLYRPSGNFFFLRNSNSAGFPDITVQYGAPGDSRLCGNWDGS
jgi:hypothetical protein